jgi:hypothetical protein
MKSSNFSKHGGKGAPKNHEGHQFGHPTAIGKGGDSGSASEHGLSQGSKVKCPLTEGSQTHLENHSLQHTDYGSLVD